MLQNLYSICTSATDFIYLSKTVLPICFKKEDTVYAYRNCLVDQVQPLRVWPNVGSKASLVTNIRRILAILLLYYAFEGMVHLHLSTSFSLIDRQQTSVSAEIWPFWRSSLCSGQPWGSFLCCKACCRHQSHQRQLSSLKYVTSVPICMASVKLDAPVGKIMNSCMAREFPAWLPPLIMLKEGTGRTCFRTKLLWTCWKEYVFK